MDENANGGYTVPAAFTEELKVFVASDMPYRLVFGPSEGEYYPLPRFWRLRLRIREWRERIGFWIAGYEPSDWG